MSATDQLLLTYAAQALNIEDEVKALRTLEAMVGEGAALIAEVRKTYPTVSSVADVLDKVSADLGDPVIAAAFSTIGLGTPYGDLVKALTKVRAVLGSVPDKYKKLLSPLSAFDAADGAVAWTLSGAAPLPASGVPGRYALDLTGKAALTFDAGAQLTPPAPAKLLKLDAGGEIKADAKFSIPYAFGALQAGAGGSAHADLAYYFSAPRTELYALAVAERLKDLPDPFDLASVWAAFAGDPTLEAVTYALGGAVNGSLQVSFADSRAIGTGDVKLDTGLTVGVSASLKTEYALVLRRAKADDGSAAIHVKLSRDRVDEESFNAALQLQADVSALTQPVIDAVKRAAAAWDAALDDIKPYLSPGTLLRQKIDETLSAGVSGLIGDLTLRKAALADLQTALGLSADAGSSLEDWLKKQIADAIDRGSVLVNGKADQAIDGVLGKLAIALPQLAKAAGQAPADKLKALVQKQLGELETAFSNKVLGLIAKPGQDFANALKAAGVQAASAAASLDDKLKPVRDLLAHYDARLHQILDAADAAAKKKLSARLFQETTANNQTDIEIEGLFTSSDAGKALNALIRGAPQDLADLIIHPGAIPGFKLIAGGSSLTEFGQFHHQSGLEVVFFDLNLTAGTVVDIESKVVLDGQGDIHLDTKAALTKKLWTPWNKREVSAVDAYRVLQAAATAGQGANQPLVLELGVGAVYSDEDLTWDNVAAFIQCLGRAGLVGNADALSAAASATFTRWGGNSLPGDLSATLRLDRTAVETLIRLDKRKDGSLSDAAQLEIIHAGLDALVAMKAINLPKYAAGAALIRERYVNKPAPTDLYVVTRTYWDQIGWIDKLKDDYPAAPGDLSLNLSGDSETQYYYFYNLGLIVRRLVTLIDAIGDIYESRAGVAGQAGTWSQANYNGAQARITEASSRWLTVLKDLVSIKSSDPTPRTLAFMRVLAKLAGGATVELTLTHRPEGKAAQTVAFS